MTPAQIEYLAERLHSILEHLDPTDDPVWAMMSDELRALYRQAVWEFVPDVIKVAKP